jgi:DUF438 domain-containing protein
MMLLRAYYHVGLWNVMNPVVKKETEELLLNLRSEILESVGRENMILAHALADYVSEEVWQRAKSNWERSQEPI